jgi:hypothetical protein
MDIKKEVTKTITTKEVIGYKCDVCGKEKMIKSNNNPFPKTEDIWQDVTTGHDGWGNDSRDSRYDLIICSPECFFKMMEKQTESKRYIECQISFEFSKRIIDKIKE